MLPRILETLIKSGVLVGGRMTAAAYLVLLERWVAAWIQDRRGPNRVGIPLTKIRLFGLGQPLADGVKFVFKEEFTPSHVDRFLYFAGPAVMSVSALAVFAVIPFGTVVLPNLGIEWLPKQIDLVVAPGVDVGMLFIFAVSSIAVYGVVLGSWASNNKYGFFGGLRSSAQLISYEIPMGLGLLGVVLMAGSLQLSEIILRQAQSGIWNIWAQPLGFLVFVVAAYAEAARLPFDLPEAEQELVGGYHTEYSGIKLMMYLVAEYMHMIVASVLIVILFFGGWHFWGLTGSAEAVAWPVALLRVVIFLLKVLAVILVFMITRWSWPRFRFDQLMDIAWKVLLPLGMVNVVAVAFWVEYGKGLAEATGLAEGLVMGLVGWSTLAVAWVAVTILVPASSDNRPRFRPTNHKTEETPLG